MLGEALRIHPQYKMSYEDSKRIGFERVNFLNKL